MSSAPMWVRSGAGKVLGDRTSLSVPAGGLGGEHDLERVVGVLGPRHRLRAVLDAVDEMTQAVGPGPGRIGLAEHLPGAVAVAPELESLGRPVVAEHLEDAVGAVQLDRRRPVLLHREPRRDRREPAVAEIDQDVGVVLGLDAQRDALDDALGDRDARHGRDGPR